MEKILNLCEEILDSLYEGVYFLDTSRKITFWNKKAESITGYKAHEVVGKHCYDNILQHVDDAGNLLCQDGCPMHKTIMDGRQREAGVYLQHKEGHRVSVAVRTIPILEHGEVVGAVEIFTDDNEQANINKTIDELKTLALYDELTQLPNRRYIDTFLSNQLREFEELKVPFAVLMIDIDHFKRVNDQYGHMVGDLVLKMLAKTLSSSIRKSDFIGRWGGEEFLAVLKGVSEDELREISEKVRRLVKKSELKTENDVFHVSISSGSTLVQKNDTVDSIQKRADRALYMSKENGRNRVTIL